MATIAPTPRENCVVAALHQVGSTWHGVIGRQEGTKLRLLDSRSFPADKAGQLDEWLETHQVERTICVLPASSVICRTTSLPNAAMNELEPALRLQAESHLNDAAPPHRRALAVLHAAPGESTRSGLILAWPENIEPPEPPTQREVTYAPDVACLAAIVNGTRVDDPLVWADRNDGSLAIAICHSQGAVLRATCENADSDESWKMTIGRVVAETAMSVGLSPTYAEALAEAARARANGTGGKAVMLMPEELIASARSRFDHARNDPRWWSDYAVPAGALLATLDQLAPLTDLRRSPAEPMTGVVDRTLNTLSKKRTAIRLGIAAAVLLAISPVLFAGIGKTFFWARFGDVSTYVSQNAASEHEKEMYRDLGGRTWSMTKLLAEISATAPVGVELNSISIDHPKGVTVRGEAPAAELMLQMLSNIADTGVFTDAQFGSYKFDPATSKYIFDISAEVSLPHTRAKNQHDYAKVTLGNILYPETMPVVPEMVETDPDPVETIADAGGGADEADVPEDDSTRTVGTAALDADGQVGRVGPRPAQDSRRVVRPTQGGPKREPLPELLTEADIKKMERDEVIKVFAAVARARNRSGLTSEQKEQYKEQAKLLSAQLQELSANAQRGAGNRDRED